MATIKRRTFLKAGATAAVAVAVAEAAVAV